MMTYKNTKVTEHRDERLCEKYYEVKHASGLSVFVFPKQRQSFCAILSCEYGSADNEFADKNGNMIKVPDGVAHFLEHKMFENDDGTSVEDAFSKLGADPNAFTKWDGTAYYYTCSNKENFYPCLDELIRFVMTPCFTEESVQKEQGIIAQEILMCEDDPYDRCFLNLVGGLYVKNPVRIDIAGTVKSISEIDSKLLFSCHDRFYTPANMALVVCGDIELDRVLESVDRGFPTDKYFDSEKPIKKIPLEKAGSNKKRVTCNMAVERSMFCLGFKDSGASDDPIERRRRQIIAEILNGVIFSSSGELYSDLYKRGIMTTPFNFGEEYGKTYSFIYVGGECEDTDIVFSEIWKHIEKLKKDGLPEKDFERRKKMTYASDIKLYDSTWDIASALLDNAFSGVELFSEFELINSVTVDDANELISELFCKDRMTYSTVIPKNK